MAEPAQNFDRQHAYARMPGMNTTRMDGFVRCGVVVILAATLLGVYTQLPLVALALQAAIFALAGTYLAAGCRLAAGSRTLGWTALAATAFLGLSAVFSGDRAASLTGLGQWTSYAVLGWLAASTFRLTDLRWLAQYLLLLGVLLALVAVYFYWGETGRVSLPVMNSIFGNKNHFGGYLLLVLPLALALLLAAESKRDRLAYLLVSILLGSTFALTYSRGAWFAIVPGLALVGWAFRDRPQVLTKRLAVVAAGTAVVAFLITQNGLGPTLDLGYQGAMSVARAAAGGEAQGTLAPRLDYWQGAIRIMLDHPLAGTGLGTFDAVFPGYELDPRFYSRFAHNFFLQTGAEAGVPALLAAVAFFGLLAAGWVKASRRAEGPQAMPVSLRAGLVAALMASTLHNLVELDWYIPSIGTLFALEAGLVLGVAGQGLALSPGHKSRRWAPALCILLVLVAAWQWSGQLLVVQSAAIPDPVTAQARLEAAAALNPLDGEPLFKLAELHLADFESTGSESSLEAAIAAAREAMARSPARDAYRVILASLYLSAGQLSPATQQLESLAGRLRPLQVPAVYRQLGEAYLRAGRLEEARSVYQRLLEGFPNGPDTPQPPQPGALNREEAAALLSEAHLALGNIHTGEGEQQKAEAEYLAALALDPGNGPASFNLGVLMFNQERWAEALVRFQWASSLDPGHAQGFYYQGLAHLKLGRKLSAESDFRAALAADPKYEDAQRALDGL